MAAPSGNTNATKWTLGATLDILENIEYEAVHEPIYTLGTALTRCRVHPGVWSYWKNKWADNEEIMDKIYLIDQIFINKLMEGAITKRLNFAACKFALRVNHGLSDTSTEESEKKAYEKIPASLKAELEEKEEIQNAPPLPTWAAPLPKMFSTVPVEYGRRYRGATGEIYTTYTDAECEAARFKVLLYLKEHGSCPGWVLPEEEYVREKMVKQAA